VNLYFVGLRIRFQVHHKARNAGFLPQRCGYVFCRDQIFYHKHGDIFRKAAHPVCGCGYGCDSKQVLLVINGHAKARALRHCVEGGVDHAWTISALQLHPDGIIACGELKVDTYKYFKEIYKDEK